MGARIRATGEIVCAAMHAPMPSDRYIDDAEHYYLVANGMLIASLNHLHMEHCPGGDRCQGSIVGGSGARLCGDGLWLAFERPATAAPYIWRWELQPVDGHEANSDRRPSRPRSHSSPT